MILNDEARDGLIKLRDAIDDLLEPPIPRCTNSMAIYRDPGGLLYDLQCIEETGHKNKHQARYEDSNNIRYKVYWDNVE